MAPIPEPARRQDDVAPAMLDLVADIEHVIIKACGLRRQVLHDPDNQLTAQALDDMTGLLAQVKLRLRVDASGNHRR